MRSGGGTAARRASLRAMVVAAVALTVVVAACVDDFRPCYQGDYRACTCTNGAAGFAACAPAQDGFAACVCDGRTPGVDGSAVIDAAEASDGALLGFMQPCQTNEQCETGLCFPFNAKGPKCSKPCATADDCPPPASGCNGMGICKAP